MITVPEITLEIAGHATADGIEEYAVRALLSDRQRHHVSRLVDGPWEVSPVAASAEHDLTVDEALTYAGELIALAKFAADLEQARKAAEVAA